MRFAFARSVALAVLLSVVLFPRLAAADPIVITGGSITLASPRSGIDWTGFVLTSADSSFSGVACCGFISLPLAGSVTLSSQATLLSTVPFPLATQQIVHGTSYVAFVSGGLTFTGPSFVVPPPQQAGTAFEFSSPFTATGHISGTATNTPGAPVLFSEDLEGSGTATVSGQVVDPSQPFYDAQLVSYSFAASPSLAPTPEPGSFALLLAAGVAGAWWLRRHVLFA
jgi:hypothetical protein